jgi:predicted transposase YbfD/YdcC
VVTADALQTHPEAAEFLVCKQRAHYLFTVKANQPTLLARCAALPWHRVPELDRTRDRGHGHIELRTLKAVSVHHLGFPHAAQVVQVTRKTRDLHAGTRRFKTVTVYAVTSLTHAQASPARLADLLRNHWAIEALHHIRDLTFAEDASQVRTGSGPHVMASLRNLAIGVLCRAGPVNVAAALRHHARDPRRPSPPSGSRRPAFIRSASSCKQPDELLAELELVLRIDSDEGRGEREVGGAVDERVAVEDDRRRRRALLSHRAGPVDRGHDRSGPGPAGVDRDRVQPAPVVPHVGERAAGTHVLRSGSNCVGAARTKPQLKVPSGHWPTNATLRGGLGSGVVPAPMKLSVSTSRRPSAAVEPSGHWNGVDQRAEAICSVKPFAADAAAGTGVPRGAVGHRRCLHSAEGSTRSRKEHNAIGRSRSTAALMTPSGSRSRRRLPRVLLLRFRM